MLDSKIFENKEQYKPSKIELHFFRHSIKESDNPAAIGDHEVKLSAEGKALAKEQSFDGNNLKQSIAFGSPRVRTQETAALMMAGKQDAITGQESFDELFEKLDAEQEFGSKVGVDERLNFADQASTPVGSANLDAMKRGEYVRSIVQNSDTLALEAGDTSGANYTHKAANLARIVEKYLAIAPVWDRLVNDPNKKYSETLERYFSTHQGMSESFLAKIIEKTDGIEARNTFLDTFPQGFTYLQGFDLEIQTTSKGDREVVLTFSNNEKKIKKLISEDMLKSIISEDEQLMKKIQAREQE